MYIKINIAILFTTILLFSNCANQKPPTGGEKDEEPPQLISSTPQDQQINYEGGQIELTFNEAIKLNNPKEQLIITPRVDIEYEVKFRKEKVIIEFESNLPDSTTFTFNFREAIQDLNEGNPAENLKLAFSTGSYLDSLNVNGSVTNLLTGKVEKDLLVGLYDVYDTVNFLEDKPYYFTKTNEAGLYEFENLAWGVYQIAAFRDKNKNLIIDPGTEVYGFLPDTLFLENNIDSLNLQTQSLDARPITLIASRQSGTTFDLKYNKYIKEYELITSDSIKLYSNYNSPDHKAISIYNVRLPADSLLTFINTTDSLYQKRQDTVYIKFQPTSRAPAKFETKVGLEKIIPATGQLKGSIDFTKPILEVNYDSAYIYLDSLNQLSLDTTHLTFSKHRDRLKIIYNIPKKFFEEEQSSDTTKNSETEKAQTVKSDTTSTTQEAESSETNTKKEQKPHIYLGPNTFISVEQDSSTRIKSELAFTKATNLATWLIEIKPANFESYTVQLLDKNYNVIEERPNETNIKFEYLSPGDYRIRILIDSNNNGYWEPGNITTQTLPEPVVYYINSENQDLISLRANWEVGPNIIEL